MPLTGSLAAPNRAHLTDAQIQYENHLIHGPRPAKDIYREAESAGYSRDQMKRSKRRLDVAAVKTGMDGGWLWRLPCTEGSAEGVEGSAQNRPLSSLPSGGLPLPSKGAVESEEAEGSGENCSHPSSGVEVLEL